jgi:hypothetical protein
MSYARDFLTDRAATFAGVQPPASDMATIPDGMYTAEIVECSVQESRKDGSPYLFWLLRITDGQYQGCTVKRFNQLATEQNLSFLKADLTAAGMTLTNLPDLPECAGDLVGRIVDVKLQTKGTYQNCYLKGLVLPNTAANVSDDDVPASWR